MRQSVERFVAGLKPKALPSCAAFLLFLGFVFVWQFELKREASYQHDRISSEMERVSLEITETLSQTSLALSRYAARVAYIGIRDKNYLDLDSGLYLDQLPILRRIGITNSTYKVIWSYPKTIASQVDGFNEASDAIRLEAMEDARRNKAPSLSRAVDLRSGGVGFLLPVPLYMKGKFSGFVYATVEASRLFHSFVPSVDFQVRILENNRQIFESKSSPNLRTDLAQFRDLKWGKSSWTIEVIPTASFAAGGKSGAPFLILFFGALISVLFGAFLRNVYRSRTNELKHARENRASLELRKAILNSSDYSIISTDVNGIIQTFNSCSAKMFGYDPEEVIGKKTPAIFHVREEVVARADALSKELGRKIELGMEVFTVKAKMLGKVDENEWTFVRKDGSRFPVNLHVSALYDKAGEVSGYLGISRDLTEQKKADHELSIAHERLTRVIESTGKGIWEREYVPSGKIIFMDAQAKEIYGFEPSDNPTYDEIVSVIPQEDRDRAAEEIQKHISGKTDAYEFNLRMADRKNSDKVRWIRTRGRIISEPGKVPLLLATVKDVTQEIEEKNQLKQALKAAEEATRVKSEFLANMSHEIRTPINGVIGMTGLLLDMELGEEESSYARTIRSSAEILLNLINDILDFSKIEAGKLELENIEFDIDHVSGNIERLLSVSANKKGLKLFRSISSDLPTTAFKGDPNRIGQILANLVSNAVKFTEHGHVDIKISNDPIDSDDRVRLHVEVSDTGIGISAEALKRMFQPFSQADVSTSRRFGGTGLGLSICKHLVDIMGGQIGVRSKEGEGSTFWFTLPLRKGVKEYVADPRKQLKFLLPAGTKKIRILLAEDNKVNQLIAIKQLEKAGFRVDAVANGNEAVEAVTSFPYDLVLMDCQMPELDGYEATRKIRAASDSKAAHIPIVAMTANAMTGDREKCLASGMNDYVVKPIKPEDLLASIYRALDISIAA